MNDAQSRAQAQALRRAASRFQRALRRTRDPESPTPSQLSALGTLHREGPLSAGELAERERLKPQSVTRLIAALADRGLVERRHDEDDRRRTTIAITSGGRRELAKEMERRDRRLAARLSALTPSQRKTLAGAAALLERLASD